MICEPVPSFGAGTSKNFVSSPTKNLDVFDHWISNDFTLELESMTSLTVTHEMFAIDSESTIFVTRIFSGNGKVVSVDASIQNDVAVL